MRAREESGLDGALYRGALFRLEWRLVDHGRYDEALPLFHRMDDLIRAMGHDEPRLAAFTATKFEDYVRQVPAFLGSHYYVRGILELNHLGDGEAAARSFALAGHLLGIEEGLNYYPRVGLAQRSRYHQALALMRAGRFRDVAAVLDQLLARPDGCRPPGAGGRPPCRPRRDRAATAADRASWRGSGG